MITAAEARGISGAVRTETDKENREKVYTQIKEAAHRGTRTTIVSIRQGLSNATIARLRDDGFEVNERYYSTTSWCYQVSW